MCLFPYFRVMTSNCPCRVPSQHISFGGGRAVTRFESLEPSRELLLNCTALGNEGQSKHQVTFSTVCAESYEPLCSVLFLVYLNTQHTNCKHVRVWWVVAPATLAARNVSTLNNSKSNTRNHCFYL